MTSAALPAARPADPLQPLLARWTAEAVELARHLDGLPLPTVDVLHRRLADPRELPEALQVAVEFAKKMTTAAWSVGDAEFAELVRLHGDRNAVALVHVLAYANFQDRLILGLGVGLENGGPLLPHSWKFARSGDVASPSR